MGEIAEGLLHGELCQGCGVYCPHGNGAPTYCSMRCAFDHGADMYELRMLRRELEAYMEENHE